MRSGVDFLFTTAQLILRSTQSTPGIKLFLSALFREKSLIRPEYRFLNVPDRNGDETMPRRTNNEDVNPQFMHGATTETAANTFTQTTLPTPVVSQGEQVYIMELLKLFVFMDSGALGDGDSVNWQLTKASQSATVNFDNPDVILRGSQLSTHLTSGHNEIYNPHQYDLSDGAGNGLLMAKRNLYFGVQGVSQAGALSVRFKLLYRLKKVPASEYIGIIEE